METENVRAVERALDILEVFVDQHRKIGLTELANTIGIPKTTTLRILRTLERRGYIRQDYETSNYCLGAQTVIVGKGFLDQLNYRVVALPYMHKIRDLVDESVSLYIISDDKRLCIERINSNQPLRTNVSVGDLLPLNRGAAGKILLAYSGGSWDEKEREKIFRSGYAVSYEEREPGSGLTGISVPIKDYQGKVCAALSISGPSIRYSEEKRAKYIQLMLEVADNISQELGYHPK